MQIVNPPFDCNLGSRKIITFQDIVSSHGTHLLGNRWGCLYPFGGVVLHHAGQNVQRGWLHPPDWLRSIRIPHCLRRLGTGNRHCFSLAALSPFRSGIPVIPLLADPRMSCGVSDNKFCVVQRNSNHNICPRSD